MQEKQHILDHISISDLPDGYQHVGELCGIETARELIEKVGGLQVYIPLPTSDKIIMPYVRKRYLELQNEDISKRRILQLIASEAGVTEYKVRALIKKIDKM